MRDRTNISAQLAALLAVAPDDDDATLAARVAELAGFATPTQSQSTALLAELVRYVDEAFVRTVDRPVDTAMVAHGTISSVGLQLSGEERIKIERDLGVEDLSAALMSFAGSTLAPQLAYAGLIDLHPPPPQPGYPPPWPTATKPEPSR